MEHRTSRFRSHLRISLARERADPSFQVEESSSGKGKTPTAGPSLAVQSILHTPLWSLTQTFRDRLTGGARPPAVRPMTQIRTTELGCMPWASQTRQQETMTSQPKVNSRVCVPKIETADKLRAPTALPPIVVTQAILAICLNLGTPQTNRAYHPIEEAWFDPLTKHHERSMHAIMESASILFYVDLLLRLKLVWRRPELADR